jgi:ketosteroid isomerase-like protein
MEEDRRFAAEVAAAAPADRGQVWAAWFSPAGRQILPGAVVQGARSIAALMGPAFATPGYSLTWEPDLASADAAGDLGWTSGRYESRGEGPEGPILEHGRYLTIWQRQPDGRWKVAVDTGVPDSRD